MSKWVLLRKIVNVKAYNNNLNQGVPEKVWCLSLTKTFLMSKILERKKTKAAEEAKNSVQFSFPVIMESKRHSVFPLRVMDLLAGCMEKVEILSKQIEKDGK